MMKGAEACLAKWLKLIWHSRVLLSLVGTVAQGPARLDAPTAANLTARVDPRDYTSATGTFPGPPATADVALSLQSDAEH